ncbi:uncharacterized protein LOC111620209 [Centruroides sculpturatus]|uniref:uncharacterized protein LOC111620209 n=1 Tax=Centruroides sculpturatus TaxID=218467 RepID=UPI000C6DDF76|nr:uncharacterized protein LOC111620209 [Centruroides sculpturatus]
MILTIILDIVIAILKFVLITALNSASRTTIMTCLSCLSFLVMVMVILNEYIYELVGSFDVFPVTIYFMFMIVLLYFTQVTRWVMKKFILPNMADHRDFAIFMSLLIENLVFFKSLNWFLLLVCKLTENHNDNSKNVEKDLM